MPDRELYVQCTWVRGDETVTAEQTVRPPSSMVAAELDLEFAVPGLSRPLRVTQYLPQAQQVQNMVASDGTGGQPAVRVHVSGRKQSYDRWLVADAPDRNRLSSLIGTWRYMAVADSAQRDELFRQFEQEMTRAARVLVAVNEAADPVVLPAQRGETHTFAEGAQRVTVRRFMPHFGLDERTHQPVNQSDKRVNPAVLIEVAHGGATEEHWLFAKFPEFQAHGAAAAPVRMRLDCPIEMQRSVPDIVIVSSARTAHECWVRNEGQIATRQVALNAPIDVPGSNYVFALTEFVPAGRLVETYQVHEAGSAASAVTVLRVDVPGAPAPVWLELSEPRGIETDGGHMTLTFGSR
jgi:hypothetical protein